MTPSDGNCSLVALDVRLSLHVDVPQVFVGFEADALAFWDVHTGTGLDVPAHSALTGMGLEYPEPSDFDAMTVPGGLLHAIGQKIHYLDGVALPKIHTKSTRRGC